MYTNGDIHILKLTKFLKDNFNFNLPLTKGTLIHFITPNERGQTLVYIYSEDNRLYADWKLLNNPPDIYFSDLPGHLQPAFTDEAYEKFHEDYPEINIIWQRDN
jgi:hypothetical protein